jgi:hypothetical protein
MPVRQLGRPCWSVTRHGGGGGQDDGHYATRDDAQAAAADLRSDDSLITTTVGQWPGPCWTAECDGPCGEAPTQRADLSRLLTAR